MTNFFKMGKREIGQGKPVYIIAEMSGNHQLKFEYAEKIVREAARAGVDAVKLQTYTADTMTIDVKSPLFQISDPGSLWYGNNLYALYKKAYTPWEWLPKLKQIADDLNIDFFSTAFDSTAVNFLEKKIDPPAHKIASFELVDIPLIEYMAKTEKPLFISTGMGTLSEIKEAVTAAQESGTKYIAIFKCTSAYPAPVEEMNLRTIPHLMDTFHVPVGLSDHSLESEVPLLAVALGASFIEKHITLSKDKKIVDAAFSLLPNEFAQIIKAIRKVEKKFSSLTSLQRQSIGQNIPEDIVALIGRRKIIDLALGRVKYGVSKGEAQMTELRWRRSLFAVENIDAGERLTINNIRSIRPADGLPPKYLKDILGKHATQTIKKGTPLDWSMISS